MKDRFLFFLICFSFGSLVNYIQSVNKLAKLFYHRSRTADKLMIYFLSMPEIKKISHNTFFISCGILDSDADAMVNAVSKFSRPWYTLKVTKQKNPQGIRINFKSLDNSQLTMKLDYAFFDSIGSQKGLVFYITLKKNNKIIYDSHADKKPLLIIDYGHGGTDNGAIGCHGIIEKQITRSVGQQLAQLLKAAGIPVALTRVGDQTVALDARTTFANYIKNYNPLFVSIHANSSPQKSSSGIETFCADQNLFLFAKNMSSSGQAIPLLCHESSCEFAHFVHTHLLKDLKKNNQNIIDRGIKKSVSQVLVGTNVPAILIELGFLTNPYEAWLLSQPFYQRLLAQGCFEGIKAYMHQKQLLGTSNSKESISTVKRILGKMYNAQLL